MSVQPGWRDGAGILVANLDADHDFETTLGLTGARPWRPPSPRARARAAELGRLLAVLMHPGDRMLGIGGGDDGDSLRRDAELREHLPNAPVLAWAETSAVAELRAAIRRANGDRPPPAHRPTGHPVVDTLWSIAPPDPVTAARCNHRGFGLQLARDLGEALPGAALVRSRGEVTELLERAGASRREATRAGVGATSWVVKAVCSSAGRDRVWVPQDGVHGGGGAATDGIGGIDGTDGRLDRLFERHGEAVVEPWVDRTADFGAVGYVDNDGQAHTVGMHRLRVDGRGRFRGVDIPPAMGGEGGADDEATGVWLGLRPGEAGRLRVVHGRVGAALAGAGYRGAYGIDAFHWRDGDGRVRLQAVGEVNARVTMGVVGRVGADRAVGRS